MKPELEIRVGSHGLPRTWYFFLHKTRYWVGKGLKNDIVLLGFGVPEKAGVVEINSAGVWWLPASNKAYRRNLSESIFVGPFELRLKRQPNSFFLILGVFSFIANLLIFRWFSNFPIHRDTFLTSLPVYELNLPARGPFGPLKGGYEVDELSFVFTYLNDHDMTLHYSPGNIQNQNQLLIQLNGQSIGFAPPAPGRWELEQRLQLPSEVLSQGMNYISFKEHLPTKTQVPWGIRDIYVTEKPKEIVKGIKSIESSCEAARHLFKKENSQLSHLIRANKFIQNCISHFLAKEGRIPPDISELKTQISEAEEKMFSHLVAKLKWAFSKRDFKEARRRYEQIASELIDPSDPRRLEIDRLWKRLTS